MPMCDTGCSWLRMCVAHQNLPLPRPRRSLGRPVPVRLTPYCKVDPLRGDPPSPVPGIRAYSAGSLPSTIQKDSDAGCSPPNSTVAQPRRRVPCSASARPPRVVQCVANLLRVALNRNTEWVLSRPLILRHMCMHITLCLCVCLGYNN